jgi:L-lactate utilization protein LutB
MNSYCHICKKHLTDFTSVTIGMGPVCRARQALQPELGLENHAVFEIIQNTKSFIFIKDTGHMNHKSVTNDVEYVLEQLAAETNIKGKRIFYADSQNEIDEIIHSGTHFSHFKYGHEGVNL